MRLRIKWKFFWAFFLVCSVTLIVAGILVSHRTEKLLLKQVEESLVAETKLVSSQFQHVSLLESNIRQIDSLTDQLANEVTARITIIGIDGKVLGDSYKSGPDLLAVENHLMRPEVQEALHGNLGKNVRFSSTVKMKMSYVALPIRQNRQAVGFARLALPLTQLGEQTEKIIEATAIALLLASVFSLLLSAVLASRLTRPIQTMTESARQIALGNFNVRIKPQTGDEISDLANYFNQMTLRLESTINQLTNEKLQLDSIVSNMKEGVLALNHRGEILLANASSKTMFLLGPDLLGKSYFDIFRHPRLNELIHKVLSSKKNESAEIGLGFPEERVVLTEAIALDTEAEDQVSAIFVFFDITKLKQLEKVRKDFVANASHELRTPLTSIIGYVEALQDGAVNDSSQARNFLEIVSRQADRMGKIISDMLLLSQIEAEGFQLKQESFALKELVAEVIEQYKKLADRKSQILELHVESTSEMVKADRDKVAQVLINLIDNAIKFTPEGGKIQVKAADGRGTVIISVQDTGIGIPSTDLPRIFERFYTADKARSRELGGTGLGLSIVKHIVEAHGGTVWAESELNKGSTFYFSLPR